MVEFQNSEPDRKIEKGERGEKREKRLSDYEARLDRTWWVAEEVSKLLVSKHEGMSLEVINKGPKGHNKELILSKNGKTEVVKIWIPIFFNRPGPIPPLPSSTPFDYDAQHNVRIVIKGEGHLYDDVFGAVTVAIERLESEGK